MDAASRRLELLKLEGLGFSQVEIVKELSVKCVTTANIQGNTNVKLSNNQTGKRG